MPALQTARVRSPSKRRLPRIAALVPFLPQATCRFWLSWTGSSSRCTTFAIGRPICRRNRAGAMVVKIRADETAKARREDGPGLVLGHQAAAPGRLPLLGREPGDPTSGQLRCAALARIGKARSRSREKAALILESFAHLQRVYAHSARVLSTLDKSAERA